MLSRFKPPYSLQTTLGVAVSLMGVLVAVVVSVLPYQQWGGASLLILALLIGLSLAVLHVMKQASQTIQEQILRSRAVVNTAPDAILGLNKDGIAVSYTHLTLPTKRIV